MATNGNKHDDDDQCVSTLEKKIEKYTREMHPTNTLSRDCKLDLEEDSYVEKFKPFMMDLVNEWLVLV